MADLGEDILQQLGDGSGIVLQGGGDIEMHQGDEAHQHLVEEIIGGDGAYHQEGGEVSVDNVHDLITLHSGDGDNQLQPDDLNAMESMMDTGDIVEEVISSQGQGNVRGQQQTFLNMAESVFNPATGTLQPVAQFNSTPVAGTSAQMVKHSAPIQKKTPQKVKFIIAQPNQHGEAGQGPLLLDAAQLQSLLSSGGASIVKTSSGQNIIIQAPKKAAAATPTKSPAKILPALVPSGDQLQQPATSTPKVFMKQGGVLTPITGGIPGGKVIQIGSGNQVRYVQLVPKKSSVPPNKIPIAPMKPRNFMTKQQGGQTIILPGGDSTLSGLGNLLVLPSGNILMKSEPGTSRHSSGLNDSAEASILLNQQQAAAGQLEQFRSLLEPNGMRPRKPCNCTKSQCLKLYCDCFANGEFCHLCNCNGCSNNLAHEEERQKAIKLVLERNPGAFRPKIGKSSATGEAHERRHNKGCNCRRSGCLKNYCECYEAKIFCSGICKCSGCKNCIENIPTNLPNGVGVEQHFAGAGTSHRQTLKDLAEAAEVRVQQQNQVRNKMRAQMQDFIPQNNLGVMVPPLIFRYPQGSISYEVVTSTVELLLAKAEAAERQKLSEGEMEKIILEEFGDCLSAVMELGSTVDNSSNAM